MTDDVIIASPLECKSKVAFILTSYQLLPVSVDYSIRYSTEYSSCKNVESHSPTH